MKRFWFVMLMIFPFVIRAQVEISGSIVDESGEFLPMASLVIFSDSVIATSDAMGNYRIQLKPGLKIFQVSYTGYYSANASVEIKSDTTLSFVLKEKIDELKEVVITGDRFSNEDILQSTRSGTNTITQKDIAGMPFFLGEADPIKTVQLLPGVVRGVEGTSDVFVRGGAADQNLVLLDGTPVYNTGHLFGFLSVFNPDMVEKVEVINGGFPAEFGGRLSSVLDVSSLSTIPEKTSISADAGLIASRMKIEQPILKDKASFWVTGRRSYIDKVIRAFDKKIPYYFYDVNGKFIYHPTRSDQVELSHYGGSDVLDFFSDSDGNGLGMLTTFNAASSSQTIKWHHQSSSLWRNNVSVFRTRYDYNIRNVYEDYVLAANSKILDYGAKLSLTTDSLFSGSVVTGGMEWTRHELKPNVVNATGRMSEVVEDGISGGKVVQEVAAYVQQERSLSKNLKINTGIRGSMAIVANKTYAFPEPRISLRYALGEDRALKVNYSRMVQYIHRISNSAVSTPMDIWSPVTDSIRPQTSHQVSLAWQRFIPASKIYLSAESYYKSMEGLINYKEGTNLLFNSNYTKSLIQGKGRAYGFEFLVRKDAGKFTGWISYSLSWSWRKFDEISGGEWFHARYDRRHNGAIVAQHSLGKRWAASMVWEFISGSRITPVVGQYLTMSRNMSGLELVPLYSEVNSVKLSDAHRLDLGIKFFNKPAGKLKWNWFAGVYNAYNRATPIGVVVKRDKLTNAPKYSQPGLFGLLPFISYGCKI